MAMLSLKYDNNENTTMGLGPVFMYQIHISHELASSCNISINSVTFIPALLTRSYNILLLGCLICLCNFVTTLIFSNSFLIVISLMISI